MAALKIARSSFENQKMSRRRITQSLLRISEPETRERERERENQVVHSRLSLKSRERAKGKDGKGGSPVGCIPARAEVVQTEAEVSARAARYLRVECSRRELEHRGCQLPIWTRCNHACT